MTQYSANLDLSTLDGTNGFTITGATTNDRLGISVASAGDVNGDGFLDLIIGAPSVSDNGFASVGASYVLFGHAGGFSSNIDVSALDGNDGFAIIGADTAGRSGFSVASAGDVNGDGISDLIIGANYATDSTGTTNPGAAYVVFGKAGGFGPTFDLSTIDGNNGFKLIGAIDHERAGYSVSSAGDINGDGFADLIVGANPGNGTAGEAYVVFGMASGFAANTDLSTLNGSNGFVITGAAAHEYFGHSVSSAGDLNGDGIDDLVVGANGADPSFAGAAYVVFGSTNGFGASVDLSALDGANGFKISGAPVSSDLGISVASAGDVNGDGIADLIVGAEGFVVNGFNTGAAYVIFGQSSGFGATVDVSTLDGTNGFAIVGNEAESYTGISVSSAGDVNGDGFADVIVGASGASPHGIYSGASYVVFGAASGLPASIDLSTLDGTNGFKISGAVGNTETGVSVASAGDLNGDGLSDLIIGEKGQYPAAVDSGKSYVVFGVLPDASVTRTGTDASQTLVGGHFDDTLNGLGGDDLLYSNDGNDTLNGGDGNDGFVMGATFTSADHIDGGNGTNDQIAFHGNYGGAMLDSASIANVEVLALQPGFDYFIGENDDFLSSGQTFTIWAVTMSSANSATVDMSAESDGNFRFFMGQGADTVVGGGGNDLIYGEGNAGGHDFLTGGGGADTFAYVAVSDSTSTSYDLISDFQPGLDKLKLPAGTIVTGIDPSLVAGASGPLNMASFDADMAATVNTSNLGAHHAVEFVPTSGDLAGNPFLIIDANGIAGYQAGEDFVIGISGGLTFTTADFI